MLCASLHHAQPVLAAALNAGFRESGVQSLKNLDDETALPMVAIRTAGLAFETLVAVVDHDDQMHTLVTPETLALLVHIANDRLRGNEERRGRLLKSLDAAFQPSSWEPAQERQARKKREGLLRRAALRQ